MYVPLETSGIVFEMLADVSCIPSTLISNWGEARRERVLLEQMQHMSLDFLRKGDLANLLHDAHIFHVLPSISDSTVIRTVFDTC